MELKTKDILLVGLGLVFGVFFYNNRKRNITTEISPTVDMQSDCEKKWNLKPDSDKGAIGATRDTRKQEFMYRCVNNIPPQVIYN